MNDFQEVSIGVVVFLGWLMMLPQQAQGQQTTDYSSQISSEAELLSAQF